MRDAKTVGFSIGSDETEQKKGGLSKKLAIFDISMQQYYNYLIGETYYNDVDCYTFTCMVKDTLTEKEKKGALIRKLVSYFDKRNFKVLYREYVFYYNHLLFDLDMQVIVDMKYVNQIHVPTNIYYKGYWNVFMIKPERAEFTIRMRDYQIPESSSLELN